MTELIAESLPQFAPATNLYRLGDGRYVLVTVPADAMPVPEGVLPIVSGFKVARVEPAPTEVFLADEYGTPIDADGDPANGMTPLLRCAPGTTHEEALAQLGAEVTGDVD
ncbi:hypothetical protein MYK68_15840 [Gordonia sp. PP30]|uniref:DUF7572 family protein n=1 Tax=Gordonia sp. PP30 TaxID=2935861 RepID=UPI001FFE5D33|nr:hypothetical protein [Gordonia sp. PP30]UQE73828.1 hypothetical protein MYK68_13925 [Gordonia sp. PP30]UQE74183.1 hypothetical protein MYK68_15840 [Gordonia sp. PP30]